MYKRKDISLRFKVEMGFVDDCMAELQMFVSVEECVNQLKKSGLLVGNLIHSYGESLFSNYFKNYRIFNHDD